MISVIEQLDVHKTVLQCTNAALKKKAKNLVILKVNGITSFTDYFIVCSGTSDRQVKGIAASIQEELKKAGTQPLGIEGENTGNWILMDYGDVIIHIFYEPTREFYDIERLWADAPCMPVGETVTTLTSLNEDM